MDLKKYWDKVNTLAATLPDETTLMSIENNVVGTVPGNVVVVDKKLAAERLVSGTHRRATPDEIDKAKAVQQEQQASHERRAVRYAPKSVLLVSPEQHRQMAGLSDTSVGSPGAPGPTSQRKPVVNEVAATKS
jgi:hypothetical protein